MKETTGTLAAAIADTSQAPIARITLYHTPHGGSFLGPAVVAWKNTESDAAAPWIGERPTNPGSDPWTNDSLILADKGQVSAFYGSARGELGLDPTEPNVIRYEGYFSPPETTAVTFLVIANGNPVEFDFGSVGQAPSAATNRISESADRNVDQRDGWTYASATLNAGDFYPFSLKVTLKAGAYGKLLLLWKPTGDSGPYRLVDAGVASPRASAEATEILPASRVTGRDEEGRASALTLDIPRSETSFAYQASTESYGELRTGRRIGVELGYQTTAGDEYLEMGDFYIDTVHGTKKDALDVIRISARDALGKVAEEPAMIIPDVLDYDLAGYSSESVWIEPEQISRYTAFDSWTLAETVRAILYRAGLSSLQLHAKDGAGDYLIQDTGIRLDRSTIYRLKLPGLEKNPDLRYAPEPEEYLLDFVRDIVSTFGYVFRLNGAGEAILREANAGTRFDIPSISFNGSWNAVSEEIDAYAGEERESSAAGGTATVGISAETTKILIFIRREVGSAVTFDVDQGASPLGVAIAVAYDRAWSWKDGIDPAVGYNPAVFEFEATGVGGTVVVTSNSAGLKIQGIELIEDDTESGGITIDGARETFDIKTSAAAHRNDVIVVGRERGPDAATFVISRATDAGSISRPVSPNFVGRRRLFLFPDNKISRDEHAAYLANRLVRKYRTLADEVPFSSTSRPELELGDAVQVREVESGILLPNARFIETHSWIWGEADSKSSFVLNPYAPTPSFRTPLPPPSPAAALSNITIGRTDGVSLDSDLFVDNELTEAEYAARQSGCFSPEWADEADSIHLKIALDIWRPGYLTLELRDLRTNRVVAVIAEDQFVEFGRLAYLWAGRWYTPEGDSFLYYPQDPEGTVQDWERWQDWPDPIFVGKDQLRSGWVYASARLDPIDTAYAPVLLDAVNADDSSKSVAHVILREKATQVGAALYGGQTVYGKRGAPDNVPHGGRFDIYTDEHTPGLPRGIRITLGHNGEDVAYQITGWIDAYIAVFESSAWEDGVQFFYLPQEWTTESLARGRHLWKLDGTVEVVQGETDFLAAGTYNFLIDPVGMSLAPDPEVSGSAKTFEVEGSGERWNRRYKVEEIIGAETRLPVRRFPYRTDYLDHAQTLFPGKIVGVGFHIGSRIRARNRAGETLENSLALYPHRLEEAANSGKEHMVWPPVIVNEGIISAGTFGRLRSRKPDGVSDWESYIAHLTLPGTGYDFNYD